MAKFYARRERMRGFGGRTAIAMAGTEEPRPAHEATENVDTRQASSGYLARVPDMFRLQWEIVCLVLKGTSTSPTTSPFNSHSIVAMEGLVEY